jgi:hypothetical protein
VADLSPVGSGEPESEDVPSGRRWATGGAGDRAQLILITGFVIAVTLVALALVMNSAIYTENLATRSQSSGANDAMAYQRAIENSAHDAFEYANVVNDSGHRGLNRNVSDALADVDTFSAQLEAPRGHVPNVSVANTTNGTEVTTLDRNFTDALVNHNWTLADDVSGVREFVIVVDDQSDLNVSGEKEFRVVANDSSSRWMMNVSRDGGGTTIVGVNASGTYRTCTTASPSVTVDVTGGTVNGTPCEALQFADGVSSAYELRFRNASAIYGDYSLVVDQNVTGEGQFGTTSEQPFSEDTLYSMTVDVGYWTPALEYRSTVRVAPGEPDE